ncbi:MAG: MMPL family transporter [Planctomycetota bacterium]
MTRPYFKRYALLILMLVCFWVPFGLRGARMASREMRNDVKDWLPDSFVETAELEEFRRHFNAEAFVMVSWDGCDGALGNKEFQAFVDEFFPELPPSKRGATYEGKPKEGEQPEYIDESLGLYARSMSQPLERESLGNRFGFYFFRDYYTNWSGQNEKWMRGNGGNWYYIVPKGDIYRWDEQDTLVAGLFRQCKHLISGKRDLKSTLVARPGDWDGPWYYKDPSRLEADLFKSVVTGPSILHDLTKPGGAMEGDVEGAKKRLNGVLFGPDGKQTCLLATLNDRGRFDLHKVVGRGAMGRPRGRLMRMAEAAGLDTPVMPSALPGFIRPFFVEPQPASSAAMIRLGGPPIDNVAIDEEGQITLARLVGVSVLVGVTLSWLSFRNIGVVMMLFFVGSISAIFSLSIVWWSRSTLDAILMSMPSLVYVLGLSGAVHIANYFRDTVDQDGYPGSPEKAIAHGWKPCALAAFTTALGLASLSTSNIVPIRKVGFFSAVGVVFTLTLLFTFLPAALALWPPKRFETKRDSKGLSELVTEFWRRVGLFAVRRHGLVTVVCMGIIVFMAAGLPRIKTSVQLLKLFHPDNKIITDYTWLEGNLGKLVPMEVLIRVDPKLMRTAEMGKDAPTENSLVDDKFRLNFLERMEIAEHVRKQIDSQFGNGKGDITGTAMLATTFVPPLPGPGGGIRQNAARGAYSRRLATYREDISKSDYFRVDDDQSELWRVSLRLGALNDTDYGQFVSELQEAVEPVMMAYRYRDELLRRIDAGRSESGGGFRGAKVLVLGAPFGKSKFASRPVATDGPYAEATMQLEAEKNESEEQQIDQVRIFSRTLATLMRNSALNYRDWHDPKYELPKDFEQRLGEYDCVLVCKDDPRYDPMLLRKHARSAAVVDARDALFVQGESLTARQRKWPISVSYTGLVPIVYKAQRTLLASLVESTGWAFVAISIVMVLLLRNVLAGAVSMLPNVFPVVVIFGFMGWWGTLVDIGTMMTASVAMGVAVDDTIHFLTWFRRGLDEGMNRRGAIMLAYDRCATAMTQTTLIGGLGLAVFALSTFMPTQRFGVLMLVLMLAALVGDLVFLPAILAGPVGRVFNVKRKTRVDSPNPIEQVGGDGASTGNSASGNNGGHELRGPYSLMLKRQSDARRMSGE